MSTDSVKVKITRLSNDVEIPQYAHVGDAGIDLRASENATVMSFRRRLIPTGISIAIPEGYAGFVLPRSGLASKTGLIIANAPGLIDSGYRGEIKVIAGNVDPYEPVTIKKGDRIAQLVILKVPTIEFEEVAELDETERGTDGFGSTGVSE